MLGGRLVLVSAIIAMLACVSLKIVLRLLVLVVIPFGLEYMIFIEAVPGFVFFFFFWALLLFLLLGWSFWFFGSSSIFWVFVLLLFFCSWSFLFSVTWVCVFLFWFIVFVLLLFCSFVRVCVCRGRPAS